MKNAMLFLMTIILVTFIHANEAIDTGYITWKQPNGVTFTARLWSDGFYWWMETQNGYRIIQGNGGYYYYAVLNESGEMAGEFAPSDKKVGIDPPLENSYQLERSSARIAAIEAEIEAFEQGLETAHQNYLSKKAASQNGIITYTLGVILVDFTPSARWVAPNNQNFPDGYEKAHFDSLIFSKNGWIGSPNPQPGEPITPHPDEHEVFGSFVNYYSDQSQETVQFEGLSGTPSIVNPDTLVNGYLLPQWVILPQSKTYYASSVNLNTYFDIASDSAESQFGVDLSQFDFLGFISAGTRQDPNLRGIASPGTGRYNITEVSYHSVNPPFFTHIGGHAHEFAHLLGLSDYVNSPSARYWHLMGAASQGPNSPNGGCPAGFFPYARTIKMGWVELDTISTDTILKVTYDSENPKYYLIASPLSENYYIIENRLREDFDLYTPNDPYLIYPVPDSLDPNGNKGGLLIWKTGQVMYPADNLAAPTTWPTYEDMVNMAGDPFPFNQQAPNGSGLHFNDQTTPGSRNSNGSYSHIAINSINWDPMDSSTTVDIFLHYGTEIINTNTTWNGIIELDRDVVVTDGAVLSIQPGTIVKVDTIEETEKVEILVQSESRVQVMGTENSPVIFQTTRANPSNQDWTGFVFEVGSEGEFVHTTFQHAATAISGNFTNSGKVEVSFSIFEATNIQIENADSTTVIRNSDFLDNCDLYCRSSSIQITGNRFLGGSHIRFVEDNSLIQNNVMVSATGQDRGISVFSNSPSTSTIINNTIAYYDYGIRFFFTTHPPVIRNNIFYKNSNTGTLPGTVTYNNFWNNDSATYQPPDTTSIEKDPKFINESMGDFRLKATSPCIDAGDPNDPYPNEPYPGGPAINMGAYGNTAEATLSFNIIAQSDLTANTTWSGYINVMEDISTNGYTLTINPGTKILFDNQTSLTITGQLSSDGDDPELGPDPIVFSGYRENDQMAGVIISNGDNQDEISLRYTHFKKGSYGLYIEELASGESLFEYLTFADNITGLYASNAELDITHGYFHNNQTGLTAHDGLIYFYQCDFDSNSVQGLYLIDAGFRIQSSNFRDNGLRGVYFDYSSEGDFYDNVISGNGYSTIDSYLRGGLVFYQSSPHVFENHIHANQAPGILSLASSYPLMIEDGLNFIAVNGAESSELDPEILVYDISFPILDYGYNDIVDTLGGNLVYGNQDPRDITLNVRENYWGTTDSTEIANRLHRPSGFDFYPFSMDWNTGGFSFNKGTGQTGNILAEALRAERDSNYTAAIILYDSLANDTSLAAETKAALERLYLLKSKTGENINTIKTYFDNLSSHPDEALATVARRIAIRCLTYNEDYQTAIGEHSAWAQTTPYFCDSVYSEIDILTNEFLASGSPFGKTAGGKTGKEGAITAQQVKAQQTRLARYQQETEKLLNLLFDSPDRQTSPLIPREFALSQNYPNPFNPATTIEYQLPFDSKVKIEIYNILGQRVKTLIDRREPAGKYKTTWDGRNDYGSRVASGLYVYRIRAESPHKTFVTAKKMILLK